MSEINKALSQLATKHHATLEHIQAADVPAVTKRPAWIWAIGGFGLSLAVGGWAVSQQASVVAEPIQTSTSVPVIPVSASQPSPTQKTHTSRVNIYHADKEAVTPLIAEPPLAERDVMTGAVSQQVSDQKAVSLASTVTAPATMAHSQAESESAQMSIEQVELTPQQLAEKAVTRASKALDSNDFESAVSAYTEALRYTPDDERVRQKLAALYYGKGDVRRAFDLLQSGIELNHNGETLRIALAKLLMKENQTEAALSPLSYLPQSPSVEYLSLRAALAQKSKFNDIALESYQLLTQKEANNGRWWLGLAIQQERAFQLPEAKQSYLQAQNKVGLSVQSQAFIRDRLNVLASLEETSNAN
ncbi:MSHA biogenesis protein MshN [Vibrio fluvialis]|uniref:tetratricopeptide repeat protein n=1 Tax=Vibrio sp. bablab_jr001 TaxID=2755067 RepID=UPI0018F17128|nr:tetratricopeptide repeat protein [Vibrio sp. bablab_jr001]EKO3400645.1 MSHA biogenesis protein MshN [Vibrio fluvialis]EKO3475019.1 MSHA biogenesis protein MshN [Vibrio fluvialis]MBY8117488.1 MSHA biogenesis protein MshN [Vibrio fluvialis]MBY8250037.1 MSHA biogenesis protein MshN [Vibrio fluvialis]MBY8283937.1 MSHA biogenesis protein MshN [Vibrio fluvialis]